MINWKELLEKIFNGEKAIINEDGQRVIGIEPLLTELETINAGGQSTDSNTEEVVTVKMENDGVEEVAIVDPVDYPTRGELNEILSRLEMLEKVVVAVDMLEGIEEVVEVW